MKIKWNRNWKDENPLQTGLRNDSKTIPFVELFSRLLIASCVQNNLSEVLLFSKLDGDCQELSADAHPLISGTDSHAGNCRDALSA